MHPSSKHFSLTDSSFAERHDLFVKITACLLRCGHSIRFAATEYGKKVYDYQAITVRPISVSLVRIGDIILYEIPNRVIAHRVVKIKSTPILSRSSCNNFCRDAIASSFRENCTSSLEFILLVDVYKEGDEPVKVHQVLGKVICLEWDGQKVHLG